MDYLVKVIELYLNTGLFFKRHEILKNMGSKIAKEEEKYMGLILIGRFLEGKPYEGAMTRQHIKRKK